MIKKNITSSFSVFMDFTYHNLTSVKTWVSKCSLTLNHSLLLKVNMTHVTLPKSNASSDLCHKWSAALKSPRRPSNYGCSYKRHLGMTTLSTLSVVVATLPGAGSKGDKWTGRASKQTLTPQTHSYTRSHYRHMDKDKRKLTSAQFISTTWSHFLFWQLSLIYSLCFRFFWMGIDKKILGMRMLIRCCSL